MKKEKIFMKSAGTRGYSPLARVFTLAVMLLTMATTAAWAGGKTVDFPIGNDDNTGWGGSMTRNGIKIQANGSNALFDNSHPTAIFECWQGEEYVTFTISMEDGSDILGVSMTLSGDYIGSFQNLEGWTGSEATRTWSGNAKSVNLRVNGSSEETINLEVTAISVTVPAAAEPGKYTVTMAAEAGEGWTIAPAEATTTGVDKDTKITATYSGTKHVKSVTAVTKAAEPEGPTLATPLTVEALTAGTIVVQGPKSGMQYSLNGGAKQAVSGNTANIPVEAGQKVAFYGDGTSITVYDGTVIQGSGEGFTCKVYGNIMSLVDENNYETATTLPNVDYVFYELFSGNTALTDASQLQLPATTLASRCYYSMFRNCVNLTAAPALPATELAMGCYQYMFYGCSNLTAAPELPATTLADYCYSYMFYNCSGLTAAPELPATTLATACYRQMFQGCTGLTAAPVLPAETLVSSCYNQMFKGCSNLSSVTCLATSLGASNTTSNWLNGVSATGTFTAASGATWTEGSANGIPSGWTRVNKQ